MHKPSHIENNEADIVTYLALQNVLIYVNGQHNTETAY